MIKYIYIYIYTYIYEHIYIYIYANLPRNAIARLSHPRSGDSRGQETFLAPSIYTHTRPRYNINYFINT